MQQDKLVSSVELLSDSVNRQTERAWVEMRPLEAWLLPPKGTRSLLFTAMCHYLRDQVESQPTM
jgi:hypothetical protein